MHSWGYFNIRDNSNPFQTTFKIFPHENLKNYHLKWPESKTKYQDGIGDVKYFDGKVIVPIQLEEYKYSKPIKLKADIDFVVCNFASLGEKNTIYRRLYRPCIALFTGHCA